MKKARPAPEPPAEHFGSEPVQTHNTAKLTCAKPHDQLLPVTLYKMSQSLDSYAAPERNKVKVIYVRESFLHSIAKDSFTFVCLFAMWFLNHRFCGGSLVIDIFVGIMINVMCHGIAKKKYSPKEATDVLRELERQDTKESAPLRTTCQECKPGKA